MLDLVMVWLLVVCISIEAPCESQTTTVKPPVIVIGGKAMMNAVASVSLSCTYSWQISVALVPSASVISTEGALSADAVTSAEPQSISPLLPVMLTDVISAVPFSRSFNPPSTFLNLRL